MGLISIAHDKKGNVYVNGMPQEYYIQRKNGENDKAYFARREKEWKRRNQKA
jgi:hypothetical protein